MVNNIVQFISSAIEKNSNTEELISIFEECGFDIIYKNHITPSYKGCVLNNITSNYSHYIQISETVPPTQLARHVYVALNVNKSDFNYYLRNIRKYKIKTLKNIL